MKHSLTGKQMAFAHYCADGLTASEAYRRVYSSNGNKTVTRVRAHEVRHHPGVSALITELQKEARKLKGADRETKRRVLHQQICDRDLTASERQNAIRLDNAMTGDDAGQTMPAELVIRWDAPVST